MDSRKKLFLTRRLKTWNYKLNINNFHWYILVKLLKWNVQKKKKNAVLKTHQEKLSNLTKNSKNQFTHKEVRKNLSSKHLTNNELDLLKFGLRRSLPPSRIYKTNVKYNAPFSAWKFKKWNSQSSTLVRIIGPC